MLVLLCYTGAMCLLCSIGYGSVGIATLATATLPGETLFRPIDFSNMQSTVAEISLPEIEQPTWLKKQLAAEQVRHTTTGGTSEITVTYDVSTRGVVTADLVEFKSQANQTLNDARGWSRMNVRFVEVASSGQFTLVLSEASQLPSFSSICTANYSCRAGRFVVINQDRWMGATSSWNTAGGSLRDYRHMVVNHEVGHWLGHGHTSCGTAGQPATIMQQQSISLQGCKFNPWPLAGELWSTQLGIKR